MGKETVDDWCMRIARTGGGRAADYLDAFEGDDEEDDFDDVEDVRAARQQRVARQKQQLRAQAEAAHALEARLRAADEQALAERQEWVRQLRAYISEHIYGPNVLVKQTSGIMVDTPVADSLFDVTPGALSRRSFEHARDALAREAGGLEERHRQALKERDSRSLQDRLALDIDAVVTARAELEHLGRELPLDLGGRPVFQDPRHKTMTDAEVAAEHQRVAAERAELQQRRKLIESRTWQAGELTEFDGTVQAARDQLVAALQASGDLPSDAKNWLTALNQHARRRAQEIADSELLDNMVAYFDARPGQKPVKQSIQQFADEYGYDMGLWEKYKKAWNAHVRKAAAAVPLIGVVPLSRMKAMNGTTPNQRYTNDEAYKEGAVEYLYHLSVSFSVQAPKKGQPDMVTITDMHVSFKTSGADRKYWFSVKAGKVTFRETAGGAVVDTPMYARAKSLLRKKAKGLNCDYT